MAQRTAIGLTGDDLTVDDVWAVAVDGAGAELSDQARQRMHAARELVPGVRVIAVTESLDPKLVAAALGLDPQAPLIYLADRIDPSLLADLTAGPAAPARAEQ